MKDTPDGHVAENIQEMFDGWCSAKFNGICCCSADYSTDTIKLGLWAQRQARQLNLLMPEWLLSEINQIEAHATEGQQSDTEQ